MVTLAQSSQPQRALERANIIRSRRSAFHEEVRHLPEAEGRALVADAFVRCEWWLASADVLSVLTWAPGVGPQAAGRLYARTGLRGVRRVGELTPRLRVLLADALREERA